mmetsp:Transcript_5886/g.21523  ORF Transcript_5886/g.21523 Transcript_5886/m.21523 type:complete len:272 (-) Transcript_5886:1012-1827(-)
MRSSKRLASRGSTATFTIGALWNCIGTNDGHSRVLAMVAFLRTCCSMPPMPTTLPAGTLSTFTNSRPISRNSSRMTTEGTLACSARKEAVDDGGTWSGGIMYTDWPVRSRPAYTRAKPMKTCSSCTSSASLRHLASAGSSAVATANILETYATVSESTEHAQRLRQSTGSVAARGLAVSLRPLGAWSWSKCGILYWAASSGAGRESTAMARTARGSGSHFIMTARTRTRSSLWVSSLATTCRFIVVHILSIASASSERNALYARQIGSSTS